MKESEALYVRQLRILERLRSQTSEFVVWDVGLGAAGNPVTLLRATREIPCSIRIVSFDNTLAPLEFALRHTEHLEYLKGYEQPLADLLRLGAISFQDSVRRIDWETRVGDFPSLIAGPAASTLPKPHAIMYDAFSPARNPAMWTQPVFAAVYQALSPERPCALPTYSRSTMLRVTLLLAGFFVGAGHATGQKEETTIAANTPDFIQEPLDRRWLDRAKRSTSAEPMWEPVYRQLPLAAGTWERLIQHPQFRSERP